MRLFVALRLLSEQYAKPAIEASNQVDLPKSTLVDANVARHHPALKNICSYLISAGVLPEMRRGKVLRQPGGEREVDLRLYWCEIETELSAHDWYSRAGVEVVIAKEEFTKFTASIRHKSGSHYVIACETYAQTLRVIQPDDFTSVSSRRPTDQAA
jgi:hypothetical protein